MQAQAEVTNSCVSWTAHPIISVDVLDALLKMNSPARCEEKARKARKVTESINHWTRDPTLTFNKRIRAILIPSEESCCALGAYVRVD